jgi:TolB-like protein/Tfp pilus assembly protein PilF
VKPEQFQRARRLFDEAMTRPEGIRADFLAEACPDDPDVRVEVERLLAQGTDDGPSFEVVRETIAGALDEEIAPGRVISHYRLEEKIGAGGMGEVFRATDLALGRTAAVKVLGGGLVESSRVRLLAEARTSARLQHPGIATFFEGGEAECGVAFLAMEYVQGETLRSRLRRGPMKVDEALPAAAALLEALAHAHAHDIVHRDIKPENVVLGRSGAVKLLDFGIAKQVSTADLEIDTDAPTVEATRSVMTALTRHGAVVGTIGYMAPEQLRGEPIDPRVDLFAVGAVLYESLAGRMAFPGKTAAERIAATVSKEVEALALPDGGPHLDAILQRALAKDRAQRYASAAEFLRDLQAMVSGEAVAILPDTLAILPFETRGGDDDAWIGGAVAESLAADLARVEGLGLLPREKVVRARAAQADLDPVATGLALGCRWVLDGTVQRMGPSIRITHRLLEVATGNVADTAKTDGKYDDLFDLQDRLAARIAEYLHLTMPERVTGLSAEHDLDAHECYNRGRALATSLDRGRHGEAESWLSRAIEIEPRHADALATLAMLHAPGRWVLNTDPNELEAAVQYSRRAIDANPRHADAHVWLGYASWRQGLGEDALAAFDRAVELAPRHPWAHYFAANAAVEFGRFDPALEHAREAVVSTAPTSFQYTVLGWCLLVLGDLDEALWTLEQAAELEARGGPMSSLGALTSVADCLLAMGRTDEARRRAMESLELIENSDHGFRDMSRTNTLCTIGRIALAQDDTDAARAAFNQCLAHLRGRPRGLGLGFTRVTSLALLARIDGNVEGYEQALDLYLGRETHDFNMAGLGAFQGRDALVSAARALGRLDDVERIRAAAVPRQSALPRDRGSPPTGPRKPEAGA